MYARTTYVLILLSTQRLGDSQAPENFMSSSRRFWNDRLPILAIVAVPDGLRRYSHM